MKIREGLTFDDVLLSPKYSEIKSRKDIDLSVDLGKGVKLKIPIISANMASITEENMVNTLSEMGGLPIFHRFCTLEKQKEMLKNVLNYNPVGGPIGGSIGVNEEEKERARILIEGGCKVICIDVAHGHSKMVGEMTSYIAKTYPETLLIAGNICTAEGCRFLYENGADVVKCGIGNGSNCTTRIEAATGVPQLTALSDVFAESCGKEYPFLGYESDRKFKIIADGGIRTAGDCVKALVFSDAVMLGSLLAGTNECPGEIQHLNGQAIKMYEGSSTHKTNHIEGIKRAVTLKGPVKPIIEKLLEGIRSGCSYQGASNLEELKENAEFIKISNAGLVESHPHGLLIK